ncbi:MAG: 3-oxoacyl-[acyl-carrier-protein] synthase III C-terminal domain-containing protein, partial [Bartonella sp.]|nr:3-oxoacyl-[acyl-carrier-protein] synthase III C-terminal domain-containing protein [Bartonella sp.]
ADSGILSVKLRSDGEYADKLYVDGGPSTTQTTGYLRMDGREVFKHAVSMITDVVDDCFAAVEMKPSQLDWFVPHQANRRIIEASAKKLGITKDRIVITIDQHGNTSAGSVPLALATAVQDGRIKKGDLIMLEAMGGGFTWGAILIRW